MHPSLPVGYCYDSMLRTHEIAGLRLLESRYEAGQKSAPHRATAGMSLDALRAMFRVERSYRLGLRRQDQPMTVTLITRRVL